MDDRLLDQVAKAIYGEAVKRARIDVESDAFDCSDMPELFRRLREESDTARILIFSSYLEDRIQALIERQLQNFESNKERKAFFKGPLQSSYNQLLLAFHLGWLSRTTRQKLNSFRLIRNIFAHRAYRVTLADASVELNLREVCRDVDRLINKFLTADLEPEIVGAIPSPDDLTSEQRLLLGLADLAHVTFRDLLILPTAKAHRVSPIDVVGSFDASPEGARRVALAFAGTIFAILEPAIGPAVNQKAPSAPPPAADPSM